MRLARALTLCLFVVGLALMIRLAILSLSPAPPAAVTAEAVAAPSLGPVASPSASRAVASPVSSAAIGLRATAAPSADLPSPSAAALAEVTPTSAPSVTAAAPSATPAPPTASAPATAAAAGATSAPPTERPAATATPRARIVDNGIDPPWWPCARGEVKGLVKLRSFYPPDHPGYSRVYAGVSCFASSAAATAAGYTEAPRQ